MGVVEDVDKSSYPKGVSTSFPGALSDLLDALDAARYRSAVWTPKVVVIIEGKRRQVIRRYEHGQVAWSASRAEIVHEPRNESPGQ
jgi:hypothetical protein